MTKQVLNCETCNQFYVDYHSSMVQGRCMIEHRHVWHTDVKCPTWCPLREKIKITKVKDAR